MWSRSSLAALEIMCSIVKQKEILKLSIFSVTLASTMSFSCFDFYLVRQKKLLLIVVQIHCLFLSWYKCAIILYLHGMARVRQHYSDLTAVVNSIHCAIGLCICVLLVFEETDLMKFRQNCQKSWVCSHSIALSPQDETALVTTKRRKIPLAVVALG